MPLILQPSYNLGLEQRKVGEMQKQDPGFLGSRRGDLELICKDLSDLVSRIQKWSMGQRIATS